MSSQVELFSKEQMLPAHIALFSRVSGTARWGCGPTSVLVTLQISLSVRDTVTLAKEAVIYCAEMTIFWNYFS